MTTGTSLHACRSCGHAVHATARSCPNCGRSTPVPLPAGCGATVAVLAAAVVLLVIVSVIWAHVTGSGAVSKLRHQDGPCLDRAGVSTDGAQVSTGNQPGSHAVTLSDGAVFYVSSDGSVIDGNTQADDDMSAGGC